MKKFFLAASLLLTLAAAAPQLEAKPAKPGIMTVTQADGTSLNVRLVGDENFHYYLSEDGYLLVNRDGKFYYADINADGQTVSAGIRATDIKTRPAQATQFLQKVDKTRLAEALDRQSEMAPRRSMVSRANAFNTRRAPQKAQGTDAGFPEGPGLFPGTSFPGKGDQKALVILVEYTDVKFQIEDPLDYFTRMLNERGFDDYGATGCAVEFFETCSNGLFRPEFDVLGPITLSRSMSYYGGNDWWDNDEHPEQMVIEACQQLDATVDFSQYDRDGDGVIDNVFVFYAGRGEASGGSADTVWPHSWNVTAATYTPYIFDGVQLDRYACSNEWEGGRPDGVGTFIHEFSHVMGLPDLYATSYTGAFTPGSWSAMDYGPYNNEGMTPPLYGAFERYALGWMAPTELKDAMNATLPTISENVAGIIPTSKREEFFLVENRQQEGWDAYIPGHGMLVWHVDYNSSVWDSNRVNNTSSHQYVDIEEADGTQSEYSRDGDTFPGAYNKTSFTDTTTPSMKTWSGAKLNTPLTDITETDGLITFKVKGGGEPIPAVVATEPELIGDDAFVAHWEAGAEGVNYLISVYQRNDETGEITYLAPYRRYNVGTVTEYAFNGLEPDTRYFYTITAARGLQYAPESNEVEAYTGAPTIARFAVEASEATEVDHQSFTAHWLPLENATDYYLTVFSREYGAPYSFTLAFDDGVETLPEGWSSSSLSSYGMPTYAGVATPSIRLTSGDHITAEFPDDIRAVEFWHRGSGTEPEDYINVYAVTAEGRTQVARVPVIKEKGGVTTRIDNFPAGTLSFRLEYVRTGSKGSVAIDDITVEHGYTYADVTLENYNAIATGNTTSYPVTGLQPEKEYYYYVVATDGELKSRPSANIKVTTMTNSSAIESVDAADAVSIKANGRHLSVTAAGAITVTDIAGHTVAASAGSLSATLPAPGVYIVKAAGEVRKLIIR